MFNSAIDPPGHRALYAPSGRGFYQASTLMEQLTQIRAYGPYMTDENRIVRTDMLSAPILYAGYLTLTGPLTQIHAGTFGGMTRMHVLKLIDTRLRYLPGALLGSADPAFPASFDMELIIFEIHDDPMLHTIEDGFFQGIRLCGRTNAGDPAGHPPILLSAATTKTQFRGP